jgi:cell division protein FtsB
MKLRTPLLNAAADDGSENGGAAAAPVNLAEVIAQVKNPALTFSQRLSFALGALQGIDPTNELNAARDRVIEGLKATNEKLVELGEKGNLEMANLREQITAREQDVTDLQARNAELEQTNADLSAREQDITARANKLVAERIAALGYPAERLPASTNQQQAEGAERIAELREQIAKETDPQKRGELALQIREIQSAQHGKN